MNKEKQQLQIYFVNKEAYNNAIVIRNKKTNETTFDLMLIYIDERPNAKFIIDNVFWEDCEFADFTFIDEDNKFINYPFDNADALATILEIF